ncbi:MAG: hypothetical protein R2741_03455 [Methanolobus sp.]
MKLKNKIIISFIVLSMLLIALFAIQGAYNQKLLIDAQKQDIAAQVDKNVQKRMAIQVQTASTALIPVAENEEILKLLQRETGKGLQNYFSCI